MISDNRNQVCDDSQSTRRKDTRYEPGGLGASNGLLLTKHQPLVNYLCYKKT